MATTFRKTKRRCPVLSDEQRARFVADYAAAQTMSSVARLHGVSITAVRNALIRSNVPIERRKFNTGKIDQFREGCEVLEALVEINQIQGGVSRDVIASACGITHERVRQIEESALRKIRVLFPEIRNACSIPHSRENALSR